MKTVNAILAAFLAAISFQVAAFEAPHVRQLGRVVITHCHMENPNPPVVVVEHPEVYSDDSNEPEIARAAIEVDAEPVPPEVGCRVVDTGVDGSIQYEGSLMVWNYDNSLTMGQVMYTASVTDGENVYRFADWANSLYWTINGSRYTVSSNLLVDENGSGLEYNITFVRRAPEVYAAFVDGFGQAILPVYDPVTIIRLDRVTEDGFITVVADYRD